MRIDEFTNKKDERELPFSVAEDLMVFMRNDPTFYRKKFYPCMADMQDAKIKGQEVNFPEYARPMVVSAMEDYCRKFNVSSNSQSVFTKEDEDALYKEQKL